MSADIDEIADLLARVKDFCANVRSGSALGIRDTSGRPVDDELLLGFPAMDALCEAIQTEIAFSGAAERSEDPERQRMVEDSSHRVDVLLAKLEGLLYQVRASKGAFELAVQVGHAAAKRKASSDTANQVKRENSESLTRQIAGFWNHRLRKHPEWRADAISAEVAAKADVSRTTLDRHLSKARSLGLIPKRHRRSR